MRTGLGGDNYWNAGAGKADLLESRDLDSVDLEVAVFVVADTAVGLQDLDLGLGDDEVLVSREMILEDFLVFGFVAVWIGFDKWNRAWMEPETVVGAVGRLKNFGPDLMDAEWEL